MGKVLQAFFTCLSLFSYTSVLISAESLSLLGEEEDEEWEDVDEEISSRPPTPLSRSPSPLADAPSSRAPSPELESGRSSPLSDIPPSRLPSPARPSPVDSWKLRQKGGKKKRQQRARQKAAQAAPFGPPPKVIHSQAHREQSRHETEETSYIHDASDGTTSTKEIVELIKQGELEEEDPEEEDPEESEFKFKSKDAMAAAELLQQIVQHRPDLDMALPLGRFLREFRAAMAQEGEESKI
ncbi:hypothetical protein B0H14DRAFT_3155485 [Mycena olivaceomarginata]|nr:hypothetical protein B0H14DRAFT_3155485 [Mycena olivaceomarginata]